MDEQEYINQTDDPWGLKKIGKNPRIVKMLQKWIGKNKKVIDIGGGYGFYADALQKSGNQMTVLDASEKMIKQGRKMFPHLHFVHANAEKMPFQSRTFDAGVCMGTLMYIQNKNTFFREVRRILKPNAIFLLYERNRDDLINRFMRIFKNTEQLPDSPEMFLKKSEIKQLAEKYDFCVKKIKASGRTFLTAVLVRR